MSLLCKQKINTKSSIEAELVEVDNAMNFVMWINLFIAEQVATGPETLAIYILGNDTVIQQDNMSSIKLEMNDKQLSTKYTRHINIILFSSQAKIKLGRSTLSITPPIRFY